MPKDQASFGVKAVKLPLAQIARLRAEFPQSHLLYEVELRAAGLVGLAQLCQMFAAAGLELVSLRATRGGLVFCSLSEAPDQPPALDDLAAALERDAIVERWVTQISYL